MDRTKETARIGDVIAVHPHHLHEAERTGEILEVIDDPGREHFRIRWDDGRESLFYPGSDATVHRLRRKEGEHAED
jgi:hypothetical protein